MIGMQLTPEQIETLAGIIVSVVVTGLLKRWWPNFSFSAKTVKVATVALSALLTIVVSKGFHFTWSDWQQVVAAIIGALGTYGAWAAARDDIAAARAMAAIHNDGIGGSDGTD